MRSLETESDVADFGLIREKVRVEGITDSPFIFGLRIFPVCPGADEYAGVAPVPQDRLHFANRNDIVIDVPEGAMPDKHTGR